MPEIKKDHVLGAGTGALAAGSAGAVVGSMLGPGGMVVGAVVGGAAGAMAGDRVSEQVDERGELGRFEQIHQKMPYFVEGMAWRDYQGAYRHGLDLARAGKCLDPQSFQQGWAATSAGSRLDARQAWSAVEHAWRMANGLDGPDGPVEADPGGRISNGKQGSPAEPR